MKTVLVGVGQAGGKVTSALVDFDREQGFGAVEGALAVNTATADLGALDLETVLIGQERVDGHGVGGDNELGAEVMRANAREVLDSLDGRVTAAAEALVVVAGLGGGTGSGGAPALARELKRVYDLPVYALGLLPGRDEGAIYQINAGRSLKTLAREADSTLLVDNDAWREAGESLGSGFESVNANVARRVGLLLAAGEAVEGVGESVVDASEVINTLRSGGVAAVGYASAPATDDPDANLSVVTSATRSAVFTGCSLPDAVDADAALLVVAGRPERVSRRGVERARSWLEAETGSMEVRGGDFPLDSDRLAALVLLGGVERSDRLRAFMRRAARAEKEAKEREAAAAANPDKLFRNDDLDGLI